MNQNSKMKILVTPELMSSPVAHFFLEMGVELEQKYTEGHNYLFAINNACPEVTHLPRLQTKADLDAKFLTHVRSYISEGLFATEAGKKLLTSYFTEAVDFDLVDRYSKDLKNIYSVKIHEYLNVGYFVDSIVVEAYKAKFDINALRDYMHTALKFAFKKVEASQERMPIDLSYSHNGEAFTVQISMEVEFFGGKSEFKEVLDLLTKDTNYFDVTYFDKKKKLTLSMLMFKDKSFKGMKSYFFTEVAKKAASSEVAESPAELHSGLASQEPVRYEAPKGGNEQSKKLAVARKFAIFIKNYRNNEERPKPLERLELIDVEYYLTFYPKQEAVKEVDDEIKNFVFRLIKDDQLFSGITDYVQKIANSKLDPQVQEIQRILAEKSLSDIEEILMIHGKGSEKEGVDRVKGWVDTSDNEAIRVSGKDVAVANNEKWEVKRSQINEKIQDEVIRINSEGRNVIQEDIIRVVAKELDAKENDVKTVVSGIVEEAVSSELVKNQKLEEAFALKILGNQTPDEVREKLEAQIARMKKVIEQMKNEIIRFQNEKTLQGIEGNLAAPSQENPELGKLKSALGKAVEVAKAKDKIIEKYKNDAEINLRAKDMKITALEDRIEEIKSEFARSREFANEEKLQILQAENKSLKGRLELANKKVNIINENIENRESETTEKHEREIESLRSNMQMAQSVIERFKQDKLEMESRFQEEREANRKLKEENSAAGSNSAMKSELAEREAQIAILQSDRKASEDKYKLLSIELKKTEQKLKYVTSQLESSNKKGGSGQKSADAYAKQLEQANSRLSEANNEVAEKRKEIVKLKQENTLMSSKIAELEKKLGVAKKAS
ncbi:hypothetical protein DOM21_02755 [Bacteriovorax stolpii]|nr:hypothetical protein DOM21_02755 [Bacteriovorax stolpii]